MISHRAPRPKNGWLPFACILTAIVLAASAGITWVASPMWGRSNAQAGVSNVGTVPSTLTPVAGNPVLASLVSPDMIEIPRLSARAPIVDVGTLPGGALDVPLNPRTVGWWDAGAEPGATKGTAILAGHINYAGVTGVLSRIGTLSPGDAVYIDGRRDGKAVRLAFTVTGVRTYDKKNLPYQQIFSQSTVGRLAIVTCGGPFDSSTGNYLDNIVAYAVPAST